MNAKQRVKNAISGGSLDRLPVWYGAEPGLDEKLMKYLHVKTYEELLRALQADFRTVRPKYVGPALNRYEDGTFDTIWGIRRGGGFWGIALNAPLENAETTGDIEKYDFPDTAWFDVDFSEEETALSGEYAIIGGEWAPFWHEALELAGLEKFFTDFYLNPALSSALLEKCFQFHYEINERLFKKHADLIDIYWFGNDFGLTNKLMINPELWRKYVKPYLKKLSEQGHRYGLKVAMHSCGDLTQIIPDLIEIGIEILNPVQVSCPAMDPEFLKKEYGRDLVFFGAIDYNQLLSYGTPDEVRAGVRNMVDILGSDGRYIVAPSHDLLMPEVSAENMIALYDEAVHYSKKYARR